MALFGKKNNDNNVQFEILPKNIGIIMDGNGRWAKKELCRGAQAIRQVPRFFAQSVRNVAGLAWKAQPFMLFQLRIGRDLRKKLTLL